MKLRSRLIKGILISLMVIMMTGLQTHLSPPEAGRNIMTVPATYAEEGEGEGEGEGEDKELEEEWAELEEEEELEKEWDELEEEEPQTADAAKKMVETIVNLANWSHRLFLPLTNFFSFQIGNFLGTDYIFSGSMGKMLQKIWVISRNLVNIAFVFILLWLALNAIFNPGFALDELKKRLLIFTLLLVAVNFSWLATKVVLDAANVVTHVTFAIPSGISDPPAYGQCQVNTSDPEKPVTGACYPTAIFAPVDSGPHLPLSYEDKDCAEVKKGYYESKDSAYVDDESGIINPHVSDNNKKYLRRTSICYENLNLLKYNQNTAVIYLTYGMARIQNLVNTTGGTGQIFQLSVGILLSLIIQIAYTVVLLTLFLALIIRMMMLWLFVGFSPFMILVIWFSGTADFEMGEFKFGFKEFANWAFVPAKVGAIFAVSFIMISAGQAMGDIDTTFLDKGGLVTKLLSPQSLFMGIGSLQNFIWLIMCLVVLWMGVFGVLSKMTIINKVTDRIRDYGKGVATLVAKAPYWAPILPLGKGGEPMAIKEMLAPLDIRSRMEKYAGVDKQMTEVRTLNEKAGTREVKNAVSEAIRRPGMAFTPKQARDFAHAFTLELDSFIADRNRTAAVEAIKGSGASEDQAKKIYDEIKKASEKTPDQIRQEAKITAPIVEQARTAAQGGVASGGKPPAPPAAQGSAAPGGGAPGQ